MGVEHTNRGGRVDSGGFATLQMSYGWGVVSLLEYLSLAVYYPAVNKYFSYMQFGYVEPKIELHIMSLLICYIIGTLSEGVFSRVSLVITTIPTLVLGVFSSVTVELVMIAVGTQIYLCLIDRRVGLPRLRPYKEKTLQIFIVFAALAGLVVLFLFRDLISFSNLLDVYGNRARYVEKISQAGGVAAYAKLIVKLLIIILSIYAYKNKSFYLIALAVAFLFYTIFSSKFMLFLPVFVWLFPIAFKQHWVFISFFLFILVLYILLDNTEYHLYLVSLVRRALLLAPRLNDIYLQMQGDYGTQYFSNSILSSFYSNSVNMAREANVYLLGNRDSNANTGLIGSSVLQLGVIGPFVYTTVYLLLANLNRGYSEKDPVALSALAVFILTAIGISDISTTLFLHGGIILCCVLRFSSQSLD